LYLVIEEWINGAKSRASHHLLLSSRGSSQCIMESTGRYTPFQKITAQSLHDVSFVCGGSPVQVRPPCDHARSPCASSRTASQELEPKSVPAISARSDSSLIIRTDQAASFSVRKDSASERLADRSAFWLVNRRYLPYSLGVKPEVLEAALQDLKRDGKISLVTTAQSRIPVMK